MTTDRQVEAAARELDKAGRAYGWWPASTPTYDNLDPIGRNELEAVVESMLKAAEAVKEAAPSPAAGEGPG